MAVQIRFKDISNRQFEAEITTFPAAVSLPKNKANGISRLFLGLFLTVFAYLFYKAGMRESGLTNPMSLIGLGVAAIGGLNIARWVGGFKSPATMLFHEDYVDVSEELLFREISWRAPYEEFSGVRMRPQKVKSKRAVHTDPYQIIELVHPDKSKTLPLYAARSKTPPHKQLEHYSEILGVPVLDYN